MKKILLTFIFLSVIGCSVDERCGVVLTKTQTINPSYVSLTVQENDGTIFTVLSLKNKVEVGEYICFQ